MTGPSENKPGIDTVSVDTIYAHGGEHVRVTMWNLTNTGPAIWLHQYESPGDEACDPNDEGGDFYGGIGLDAANAELLGTFLLLAAEQLKKGTDHGHGVGQ